MTTIFRRIAHLVTLQKAAVKQGRAIVESDLSVLKNSAVVVEDGRIVWVGEDKKLPKTFKGNEISCAHKTMLPGFVECHTHSLFAGSRSHEFEKRLQGLSYQEIAKQGGGILSTVSKTRALSLARGVELLQANIKKFTEQGVTTLEVKTGYGLDHESELRSLKIIGKANSPRVIKTFLGAHAIAPEFADETQYLIYLENILPKVKKDCHRLDIYIEKGFFSVKHSLNFLNKAQAMGFDLVIHANQLSNSSDEDPGGVEVALQLGAQSAEHLIHLSDEQIKKLAASEVTCVLLPVADLYMKCPYPPARKLIDQGARVALATDFNPGTSPSPCIDLAGLLARIEMKMTLPEVIAAYTIGGAFALGLQNTCGSIEFGKSADFVTTPEEWTDLFYEIGPKSYREVYFKGSRIK